jgi:hypothetical protein
MDTPTLVRLPPELATELEGKFFWWAPVGDQPRSDIRILTQAMTFSSFDETRRLETTLGPQLLAEAMLQAEPGWIDPRSWEFWRGRLTLATGRAIPMEPPQRTFDVNSV